MTKTFVTPAVNDVPPTLPNDWDLGDRLFRFFRARPSGVNVYLYKAGSLSAVAHGRVDETDPIALYDTNGVVTTNGWEDLETVFWGGCQPVEVTDEQATVLTAAGYTIVET